MLGIINDILDIERLESGKVTVELFADSQSRAKTLGADPFEGDFASNCRRPVPVHGDCTADAAGEYA